MKFLYVLSSFLLMTGLAHGQIRIGGSDLLASRFADALAEYAGSRGIDVSVDFTGSYPGMEALKKGELDLAIVAIPDGGQLPENFRSVHFSSKVLVVAVPPANPLNQISLRQLAAVYGEAEASSFTRWGQLGLTGEWTTRSISLRSVSQSDHTLALDLFRHSVLQSRGMKRNVTQATGIEGIRTGFLQDNNGIALLHRVPADASGLKILPIARTDTDLAHGPTPEAVANNDYPLRLPLYLVFSNKGAGELKDLLRYMVSEEAAEAIEANDLTPLSDQRRQRLFLEFERL